MKTYPFLDLGLANKPIEDSNSHRAGLESAVLHIKLRTHKYSFWQEL